MHEAEQLIRQLGDATSIKDKALRQGVPMADLEAAVRSLVASKVVIGLQESVEGGGGPERLLCGYSGFELGGNF